ncbi:hypothetical protein AY547_02540 [Corynebacterium diphtheriae bv. gravis]|nr:hypothetical protein BS112_00100 [Corynebacterium diphtheriae]ERA53434.1 hypothetical protein B179_03506 [Corynebacterium diphtheriae str. Aberdeen]KLN40992.1 hypothetical protein AL07_03980 [Corynebacterium diphtheriae bv. gravis str. ISS 4060]KLN42209.1 hypothetical protein AL08_03545 [Corynebacterium diphtheriae bv. gravis str. ISS 4746]KLN44811.1 hypothetical protein AL09_03630 [Corynebacterium diphtheriae bv. gravis str. ISS 4749]OWM99532.1 hypothetical protein AY476_01290 [Corynebacte
MIRQLVKYLYIKVWVAGFLLGWGRAGFSQRSSWVYTLAGCLHLYSVGEHRETQLEHDLHRDVENRLEVSILREIERI